MTHERQKRGKGFSRQSADAGQPDASRFEGFKYFGYGLILAAFGITVSLNDFGSMWSLPSTHREEAFFAAHILLFAELTLLALRWIISTHVHFEQWVRWLSHPFAPRDAYAALCGLPIVVGVLAAFPHRIVIISGLMTVYFYVNYWTQWLSNEHFVRALQKTRERPGNTTPNSVLLAMEQFWLRRPQLARITSMMFCSFIAFALAVIGELRPQPMGDYLILGAYAVLILDILVSEIVIGRWRYKLEQKIDTATGSKG